MIRRFLIALIALGLTGSAASAAVTFNFEAGQATYNVTPGGTVNVPIYLKETVTTPSTSQIVAEDGLFSFGITVDQTSGGGQMTNLARNSLFDRRNPGSTTTFPADPILLWADQDTNFGNGPDPVNGRILLATLSFQAPGASGTTTFNIGDFGAADQTVTYLGSALDSGITGGSFSIVTAIPEPSAALLMLAAPVAAMLRRHRQGC